MTLRTLLIGPVFAAIIVSATPASAGEFTVLHRFDAQTDGGQPAGGVAIAGNGDLYGTTSSGGAMGAGTLFRLRGSSLVVLHPFSGAPDGALSTGSVAVDARGRVYGTTADGGADDRGAVFSYSDKAGYSILSSFLNGFDDGATPFGGPVLGGDGALYGTTTAGGSHTVGTLYRVDTRTGQRTTIHQFDYAHGARPYGSLLSNGKKLYGGTSEGGQDLSAGVVFDLSSSGKKFKAHSPPLGKGFDVPPVMDDKGNLWGVFATGGDLNQGGIYRIDPAGRYKVMKQFDPTVAFPAAIVIGKDGMLYGSTAMNGFYSSGTLFRFDPKTKDLQTIHDFDGDEGGEFPKGPLSVGPDGALYGTTYGGGLAACICGAVFRFVP